MIFLSGYLFALIFMILASILGKSRTAIILWTGLAVAAIFLQFGAIRTMFGFSLPERGSGGGSLESLIAWHAVPALLCIICGALLIALLKKE